ncbi:MAG: GntR family transcriptional regulator [Acidobacteriaceae bacterium]
MNLISSSPTSSVMGVQESDDLEIALSSSSYVPYYEQIVEQIRGLIRSKKLIAGQHFYSEGELSRRLGISKMPVRQAFQKLRSEGLLIIVQGKRPAIGSGCVPWDFRQLRGFSEEMRRRGLVPSARLLSSELQDSSPDVAQALHLSNGQPVYHLKRLRLVDNQPVAVVTSYLPSVIFAGIEKLDLARRSLYDIMENVYKHPLQWADEVIGAVIAGPEEAHILQTVVGSALLLVKETTYDVDQTPVEYSISLLRGDRYTASVTSLRTK